LLLQLRVKDLGIIEEINWCLEPGLNVITGETGAGKSLVIDAVEALLGGKLEDEAVRHEAREAHIEGVFALPEGEKSSPLRGLLSDKGLDSDEDSFIISCALRREGRSVLRINGHAVSKGVLGQIGRLLIDIHGQSEHLSLLDRKYHLDFLDCYASTLDLRRQFGAAAAQLYTAEQELRNLARKEDELARREEFLRFQVDEIERARLQDGEEEDLRREQRVLSSSEKLKAFSYEAYQAIYGQDGSRTSSSAMDKLNEAIGAMKKLVDFEPAFKQQLSFLEDTSYGLEEAARDIRSYGDRMEYDPKRVEEIESRLDTIRNLKRKYGQATEEILGYLGRARQELDSLSHSSERKAELGKTCSHLKQEMGRLASELSQARYSAACRLASAVTKELHDLNMSQVKFEVSITRDESPDGIPLANGRTYAFTDDGADIVEFMASTNPGEPMKPLARIASTGEISRFMLALKSALSHVDTIPVLVFDEIDIGVGGRSGEVIGRKLWSLAQNRQVICVTHLPQIAAFADAHYNIHKEVSRERTLSLLDTLQDDSKIQELAAMLGGQQFTETALGNARELLHRAQLWKEEQRGNG